MIQIEDVSMQFGGTKALSGLTARLDEPVCGLIGPNGAGKTTLLNVFCGFVKPQIGSVRVDGRELLGLSPAARARYGLRRSFQSEQVVEDLSVWDNVRAVLDHMPHDRSKGELEIFRALDHCNLLDRCTKEGAALNLFERRMLELAKTLVGSPRLLLLDEPGAGLSDPEVAKLREAIAGLHQTFGVQVLLIDHDVELISALCSQTLVLDFGRRLAFGPTKSVLADDDVRRAYLGEDVVSIEEDTI